MLKPRARLIFCLLLLPWLVTCPAGAESPPSGMMKLQFSVTPDAQVVTRGSDVEKNLGWASQIKAIDLDRVEFDGERKEVQFKFLVPIWFGRVWESSWQTATYDELRKAGTFPPSGTVKLPIPLLLRFQSAAGFEFFLLALTGLLLTTGWVAKRRKVSSAGPSEVRFSDYTLIEQVGSGGMGEVYRARTAGGEIVALKSLLPHISQQEDFRKRFLRESATLQSLQHRHLLRHEADGIDPEGRLFVVTEFLQGQTLKEVLKSGDYHPPHLASDVLEQIGSCLQYLHDQKMIHRDVKPDNIFRCDDGTLKLMDLGLVWGDEMTVLTMTGQVMGTPAYISPDQINGEPIAASDQYSLGIVLYEILTGQRPFRQPKPEILLYQHLKVAPERPSAVEPRIPPEVEEAVLKMLEKDPEARFDSMETARSALSDKLLHLNWASEQDDTNTIDTSLESSS